ncbi:MAG: hypothetical protein O7B99_12300, partial [Planctomycetota bacterium]|nr:hypothetical protein [Planctomycetota bacterium]
MERHLLPAWGMFPGVQETQLAPDLRPVLLVVIDTEEEFDWSKPHDRNETAVEAMRFVERGRRLFEEFGIRPTYAIDYPVATQQTGIESLKPIVESGRAVLAALCTPGSTRPTTRRCARTTRTPGTCRTTWSSWRKCVLIPAA